jgi:glutamate racemase
MHKAIGIFDSGIGGLTVFKAIKKLLPNEKLIYFGDTARIPYGTKSEKLVQQYALEDAVFLLQYNIKMIVIACNTASSMALDFLKSRLEIPVIGVVIPGSAGAVRETKNKTIGVIGTSATINSGAYKAAILSRMENARIYSQACPLLVPLVEEGWLEGNITELILNNYLSDILTNKPDTIILGCTHYPLLSNTIQQISGQGVTLIDSGKETARYVEQVLAENNLLNEDAFDSTDQFFVSDIPQKFEAIGTRFLGETMGLVMRVDFEKFLEDNSIQIKELKENIKTVVREGI